ncbi:SpoIIIAC/SpoIIIAD family protein [Caldicellulosiruptoraceae bacterium PP1]
MELFNVIIICLVSLIFVIIIKKTQPEFSLLITIITGIAVFFIIYDKIAFIIGEIIEMNNKVFGSSEYIGSLIKMTGIALITDYASNICKDSGESAFAFKIELAGKVIILFLSLPILFSLINFISKFI